MAQDHSSGIWKSRGLDQCLCKEDTQVPLKTCRATFETLQTHWRVTGSRGTDTEKHKYCLQKWGHGRSVGDRGSKSEPHFKNAESLKRAVCQVKGKRTEEWPEVKSKQHHSQHGSHCNINRKEGRSYNLVPRNKLLSLKAMWGEAKPQRPRSQTTRRKEESVKQQRPYSSLQPSQPSILWRAKQEKWGEYGKVFASGCWMS